MGYKSKHDAYGKKLSLRRADFLDAVELMKSGSDECRAIEEYVNGTRDSVNEMCFTVSGNHQPLNFNIKFHNTETSGYSSKSDTEFVLIDPRYMEGKKSERGADFYSIKIVDRNKYRFEKITMDQLIRLYDPEISNKKLPKNCDEYKLRKNLVLYKLGFESRTGKILDLIKTDPPIEKPRRGFFGTIRDWFGKDNPGRKEYERARSTYKATKFRIIENQLGIEGLRYRNYSDEELVNRCKYIGGYVQPVKQTEAVSTVKENLSKETKAAPSSAGLKEKAIEETLQYFKKSSKAEVAAGAEKIGQYLKENKNTPLSSALSGYLLKKGECVRVNNLTNDSAIEFLRTFKRACRTVNDHPEYLEKSGSTKGEEILTNIISPKTEEYEKSVQ